MEEDTSAARSGLRSEEVPQAAPPCHGATSEEVQTQQEVRAAAVGRYEAKVDRRGPDDCHLWTAATDRDGYGLFWNGEFRQGDKKKPRMVRAHRFGYEAHVGPIPEGMQVCHSCDTPDCQNNRHHFLGTPAENHDDMARKGRRASFARSLHPNARLSDKQVRKIRKKYRSGKHTQKSLAATYGVSKQHISDIVRSKKWT